MSLAFERRGPADGEPLVLLHGIGHHWRAWEPVLDLLAATLDVIAVDLPGFGRSAVASRSRAYRGMPDLVDDLTGFFAAIHIERPHVAGNSLGGAIALELAAAGRVASATALSPAGFATAAQLRRALTVLNGHRLGAFAPSPLLRALYATTAGRTLAFGRLVARPDRITPERALADTLALRRGRGFRRVARRGRAYAFEPGAPAAAGVPVTVAWGTRDAILPYAQAARARAALPGARHVELPGCGHVPMSDDPGLVARVILETVAAAAGSPAAGAS